MNYETHIDEQAPKKKRSRVKWFTFIFGAALILLGYRTYGFSDPRLTPEMAAALARAGVLFFSLGGLALAVGILGSVVRAPWVKLIEAVEALAFVGAGCFLLAMRGSDKGGGLFNSPVLPTVLMVIGIIKGVAIVLEYRKLRAAGAGKR